jgi:hypothetical protein
MPRGPDAHQQRFAQLAWHFNCHIAAMAHTSWLHHPHQAADREWSAHLLARCGVERLQDWRLADTASRLWLLDAASLHMLLEALRGVLQRRQLARAVSKTRRDELRAQWSDATWQAAGDATAPMLDPVPLPDDAQAAARGSARLLRGLLDPSRQAVVQRARIRLPHEWRDDEPVLLSEKHRNELADWIARRWIPQRSAAWAWLF